MRSQDVKRSARDTAEGSHVLRAFQETRCAKSGSAVTGTTMPCPPTAAYDDQAARDSRWATTVMNAPLRARRKSADGRTLAADRRVSRDTTRAFVSSRHRSTPLGTVRAGKRFPQPRRAPSRPRRAQELRALALSVTLREIRPCAWSAPQPVAADCAFRELCGRLRLR